MRLSTNVTVEKDTWTIPHTYDETDVLQQCKEDRNSGFEGTLATGEGKLIARIPRHRFFSDFELQMYQEHQGKDNKEAETWLRKWLFKNPEFRTTTGKSRFRA